MIQSIHRDYIEEESWLERKRDLDMNELSWCEWNDYRREKLGWARHMVEVSYTTESNMGPHTSRTFNLPTQQHNIYKPWCLINIRKQFESLMSFTTRSERSIIFAQSQIHMFYDRLRSKEAFSPHSTTQTVNSRIYRYQCLCRTKSPICQLHTQFAN